VQKIHQAPRDDSCAKFLSERIVSSIHDGSGGHRPHLFDAITPLKPWVKEGIASAELLMSNEEGARSYREPI
tara:strand:- start:6538 stop:6753 length:216 start_codon:yes stop_codon:yes gene_type:complete